MNGIARAGLAPGVDISVTGYDDLEEAAIATPALTTVWNGQREVGRQGGTGAAGQADRAAGASLAGTHQAGAACPAINRQASGAQMTDKGLSRITVLVSASSTTMPASASGKPSTW